MEEHQRQHLLTDYEGLVANIRSEAEGVPSPGDRYWIDNCDRVIAWLRGGPRPERSVRKFLEKRLEGFHLATDFERLAYEHDALVAAIEELR